MSCVKASEWYPVILWYSNQPQSADPVSSSINHIINFNLGITAVEHFHLLFEFHVPSQHPVIQLLFIFAYVLEMNINLKRLLLLSTQKNVSFQCKIHEHFIWMLIRSLDRSHIILQLLMYYSKRKMLFNYWVIFKPQSRHFLQDSGAKIENIADLLANIFPLYQIILLLYAAHIAVTQ